MKDENSNHHPYKKAYPPSQEVLFESSILKTNFFLSGEMLEVLIPTSAFKGRRNKRVIFQKKRNLIFPFSFWKMASVPEDDFLFVG
jgi:hypothetical protein